MFFFSKNKTNKIEPGSIEHAYLAILDDDIESARMIFEKIDSPRAHWGKALIDIINGYVEHYPTYFEIRNFLEIDMDFLIKNEKIDYTENLLGSLDILYEINQESYKYTARVMYENRLYNASKKYMDKSKGLFYGDPELHFMLAKYYIHTREYEAALDSINNCLGILPEYFPAKALKEELKKYVKQN